MSRLCPPGCPLVLSVSFWVGWVLTAVVGVVDQGTGTLGLVAVLLALLVLWVVLPWEPTRGLRAVLPVVFLIAALSVGGFGGGATYLPLLLASLANMTLSLGLVPAIFAAVGDVLLIGLASWAAGWTQAADLMADVVSLGVLSLFAISMAHAVSQARSHRNEAVALLAQVEELTIAEERARMARDMHDSLGHSLTAVKFSIDSATRLDGKGRSDDAWRELDHARSMVVDALVETRRWVRALRPAALSDGIGEQAFRELAASFRGAGVAIEYQVTGDTDRISPRTQLVAYRVVQECLANAVRYSRAATVTINLAVLADTVRVSIADDGVGAGGRDIMVGGFGLAALSERAAAIGGALSLDDAVGGLCVQATLPLVPTPT